MSRSCTRHETVIRALRSSRIFDISIQFLT
jgi:hypothetical protein